jgi:transposase
MVAVGIDVSKGKSTVAAISGHGELLMKVTDYHHDEKDLNELIKRLRSFNDDVRIIMEATGQYHFSIRNKLIQEGFFVSVINPYLMKKYSESSLRKGKTDRKDALKIAVYCLEKWRTLIPYTREIKQYEDLKFLSRQYNQLISTRIKQKVQLDHLLELVMPGIKTIFNYNSKPQRNNALYDFVEKYKHFSNIKNMNQKSFIKSYTLWSNKKGYRNGEAKAERIYALAQNSILSRGADSTTYLALIQCLQLLRQAEVACTVILSQMSEIARELPEYEVVRSMAGVGEVLAPRLIAEIGDVRRFTSAKALNAFAGNDAPPFQSGQFEATQRHISKRGSASLRKVGYEIMRALTTNKPSDEPVYQYIMKKESEGKAKNVAKMAGLNKFLRIYYARVNELYLA